VMQHLSFKDSKSFPDLCQILSAETQTYSGIWVLFSPASTWVTSKLTKKHGETWRNMEKLGPTSATLKLGRLGELCDLHLTAEQILSFSPTVKIHETSNDSW